MPFAIKQQGLLKLQQIFATGECLQKSYISRVTIFAVILARTLLMTVKIAKVMWCKHVYVCYDSAHDKLGSLNALIDVICGIKRWFLNVRCFLTLKPRFSGHYFVTSAISLLLTYSF